MKRIKSDFISNSLGNPFDNPLENGLNNQFDLLGNPLFDSSEDFEEDQSVGSLGSPLSEGGDLEDKDKEELNKETEETGFQQNDLAGTTIKPSKPVKKPASSPTPIPTPIPTPAAKEFSLTTNQPSLIEGKTRKEDLKSREFRRKEIIEPLFPVQETSPSSLGSSLPNLNEASQTVVSSPSMPTTEISPEEQERITKFKEFINAARNNKKVVKYNKEFITNFAPYNSSKASALYVNTIYSGNLPYVFYYDTPDGFNTEISQSGKSPIRYFLEPVLRETAYAQFEDIIPDDVKDSLFQSVVSWVAPLSIEYASGEGIKAISENDDPLEALNSVLQGVFAVDPDNPAYLAGQISLTPRLYRDTSLLSRMIALVYKEDPSVFPVFLQYFSDEKNRAEFFNRIEEFQKSIANKAQEIIDSNPVSNWWNTGSVWETLSSPSATGVMDFTAEGVLLRHFQNEYINLFRGIPGIGYRVTRKGILDSETGELASFFVDSYNNAVSRFDKEIGFSKRLFGNGLTFGTRVATIVGASALNPLAGVVAAVSTGAADLNTGRAFVNIQPYSPVLSEFNLGFAYSNVVLAGLSSGSVLVKPLSKAASVFLQRAEFTGGLTVFGLQTATSVPQYYNYEKKTFDFSKMIADLAFVGGPYAGMAAGTALKHSYWFRKLPVLLTTGDKFYELRGFGTENFNNYRIIEISAEKYDKRINSDPNSVVFGVDSQILNQITKDTGWFASFKAHPFRISEAFAGETTDGRTINLVGQNLIRFQGDEPNKYYISRFQSSADKIILQEITLAPEELKYWGAKPIELTTESKNKLLKMNTGTGADIEIIGEKVNFIDDFKVRNTGLGRYIPLADDKGNPVNLGDVVRIALKTDENGNPVYKYYKLTTYGEYSLDLPKSDVERILVDERVFLQEVEADEKISEKAVNLQISNIDKLKTLLSLTEVNGGYIVNNSTTFHPTSKITKLGNYSNLRKIILASAIKKAAETVLPLGYDPFNGNLMRIVQAYRSNLGGDSFLLALQNRTPDGGFALSTEDLNALQFLFTNKILEFNENFEITYNAENGDKFFEIVSANLAESLPDTFPFTPQDLSSDIFRASITDFSKFLVENTGLPLHIYDVDKKYYPVLQFLRKKNWIEIDDDGFLVSTRFHDKLLADAFFEYRNQKKDKIEEIYSDIVNFDENHPIVEEISAFENIPKKQVVGIFKDILTALDAHQFEKASSLFFNLESMTRNAETQLTLEKYRQVLQNADSYGALRIFKSLSGASDLDVERFFTSIDPGAKEIEIKGLVKIKNTDGTVEAVPQSVHVKIDPESSQVTIVGDLPQGLSRVMSEDEFAKSLSLTKEEYITQAYKIPSYEDLPFKFQTNPRPDTISVRTMQGSQVTIDLNKKFQILSETFTLRRKNQTADIEALVIFGKGSEVLSKFAQRTTPVGGFMVKYPAKLNQMFKFDVLPLIRKQADVVLNPEVINRRIIFVNTEMPIAEIKRVYNEERLHVLTERALTDLLNEQPSFRELAKNNLLVTTAEHILNTLAKHESNFEEALIEVATPYSYLHRETIAVLKRLGFSDKEIHEQKLALIKPIIQNLTQVEDNSGDLRNSVTSLGFEVALKNAGILNLLGLKNNLEDGVLTGFTNSASSLVRNILSLRNSFETLKKYSDSVYLRRSINRLTSPEKPLEEIIVELQRGEILSRIILAFDNYIRKIQREVPHDLSSYSEHQMKEGVDFVKSDKRPAPNVEFRLRDFKFANALIDSLTEYVKTFKLREDETLAIKNLINKFDAYLKYKAYAAPDSNTPKVLDHVIDEITRTFIEATPLDLTASYLRALSRIKDLSNKDAIAFNLKEHLNFLNTILVNWHEFQKLLEPYDLYGEAPTVGEAIVQLYFNANLRPEYFRLLQKIMRMYELSAYFEDSLKYRLEKFTELLELSSFNQAVKDFFISEWSSKKTPEKYGVYLFESPNEFFNFLREKFNVKDEELTILKDAYALLIGGDESLPFQLKLEFSLDSIILKEEASPQELIALAKSIKEELNALDSDDDSPYVQLKRDILNFKYDYINKYLESLGLSGDEKEVSQLEILQNLIDQLTAEKQELENTIKAQKEEYANLQKQFNLQTKELQKKEKQIQKQEEYIEKRKKEIEQKTEKIKSLIGEINARKEKIKELLKKISTIKAEQRQQNSELIKARHNSARLQKSLDKSLERFNKLKDKLEKVKNEASISIEEKKAKINELLAQLKQEQNNIIELRKQKNVADSLVKSLTNKLEKSEKRFEELKKQFLNLQEAKRNLARTLKKEHSEKESLKNKLEKLRTLIQSEQEKYNNLKKAFKENEKLLSSQEQTIKDLEAEIERLTNIQSKKDEKIKDLEENTIKLLEEEIERIKAQLEKERANKDKIKDSEEENKEQTKLIQQQKEIISKQEKSIKRLEAKLEKLEDLLKKAKENKKLKEALEKNKEQAKKIKELERAKKEIIKTTTEEKSKIISEYTQKINELKKELDNLQAQKSSLEEKAQAERNALENKIRQISAEILDKYRKILSNIDLENTDADEIERIKQQYEKEKSDAIEKILKEITPLFDTSEIDRKIIEILKKLNELSSNKKKRIDDIDELSKKFESLIQRLQDGEDVDLTKELTEEELKIFKRLLKAAGLSHLLKKKKSKGKGKSDSDIPSSDKDKEEGKDDDNIDNDDKDKEGDADDADKDKEGDKDDTGKEGDKDDDNNDDNNDDGDDGVGSGGRGDDDDNGGGGGGTGNTEKDEEIPLFKELRYNLFLMTDSAVLSEAETPEPTLALALAVYEAKKKLSRLQLSILGLGQMVALMRVDDANLENITRIVDEQTPDNNFTKAIWEKSLYFPTRNDANEHAIFNKDILSKVENKEELVDILGDLLVRISRYFTFIPSYDSERISANIFRQMLGALGNEIRNILNYRGEIDLGVIAESMKAGRLYNKAKSLKENLDFLHEKLVNKYRYSSEEAYRKAHASNPQISSGLNYLIIGSGEKAYIKLREGGLVASRFIEQFKSSLISKDFENLSEQEIKDRKDKFYRQAEPFISAIQRNFYEIAKRYEGKHPSVIDQTPFNIKEMAFVNTLVKSILRDKSLSLNEKLFHIRLLTEEIEKKAEAFKLLSVDRQNRFAKFEDYASALTVNSDNLVKIFYNLNAIKAGDLQLQELAMRVLDSFDGAIALLKELAISVSENKRYIKLSDEEILKVIPKTYKIVGDRISLNAAHQIIKAIMADGITQLNKMLPALSREELNQIRRNVIEIRDTTTNLSDFLLLYGLNDINLVNIKSNTIIEVDSKTEALKAGGALKNLLLANNEDTTKATALGKEFAEVLLNERDYTLLKLAYNKFSSLYEKAILSEKINNKDKIIVSDALSKIKKELSRIETALLSRNVAQSLKSFSAKLSENDSYLLSTEGDLSYQSKLWLIGNYFKEKSKQDARKSSIDYVNASVNLLPILFNTLSREIWSPNRNINKLANILVSAHQRLNLPIELKRKLLAEKMPQEIRNAFSNIPIEFIGEASELDETSNISTKAEEWRQNLRDSIWKAVSRDKNAVINSPVKIFIPINTETQYSLVSSFRPESLAVKPEHTIKKAQEFSIKDGQWLLKEIRAYNTYLKRLYDFASIKTEIPNLTAPFILNRLELKFTPEGEISINFDKNKLNIGFFLTFAKAIDNPHNFMELVEGIAKKQREYLNQVNQQNDKKKSSQKIALTKKKEDFLYQSGKETRNLVDDVNEFRKATKEIVDAIRAEIESKVQKKNKALVNEFFNNPNVDSFEKLNNLFVGDKAKKDENSFYLKTLLFNAYSLLKTANWATGLVSKSTLKEDMILPPSKQAASVISYNPEILGSLINIDKFNSLLTALANYQKWQAQKFRAELQSSVSEEGSINLTLKQIENIGASLFNLYKNTVVMRVKTDEGIVTNFYLLTDDTNIDSFIQEKLKGLSKDQKAKFYKIGDLATIYNQYVHPLSSKLEGYSVNILEKLQRVFDLKTRLDSSNERVKNLNLLLIEAENKEISKAEGAELTKSGEQGADTEGSQWENSPELLRQEILEIAKSLSREREAVGLRTITEGVKNEEELENILFNAVVKDAKRLNSILTDTEQSNTEAKSLLEYFSKITELNNPFQAYSINLAKPDDFLAPQRAVFGNFLIVRRDIHPSNLYDYLAIGRKEINGIIILPENSDTRKIYLEKEIERLNDALSRVQIPEIINDLKHQIKILEDISNLNETAVVLVRKNLAKVDLDSNLSGKSKDISSDSDTTDDVADIDDTSDTGKTGDTSDTVDTEDASASGGIVFKGINIDITNDLISNFLKLKDESISDEDLKSLDPFFKYNKDKKEHTTKILKFNTKEVRDFVGLALSAYGYKVEPEKLTLKVTLDPAELPEWMQDINTILDFAIDGFLPKISNLAKIDEEYAVFSTHPDYRELEASRLATVNPEKETVSILAYDYVKKQYVFDSRFKLANGMLTSESGLRYDKKPVYRQPYLPAYLYWRTYLAEGGRGHLNNILSIERKVQNAEYPNLRNLYFEKYEFNPVLREFRRERMEVFGRTVRQKAEEEVNKNFPVLHESKKKIQIQYKVNESYNKEKHVPFEYKNASKLQSPESKKVLEIVQTGEFKKEIGKRTAGSLAYQLNDYLSRFKTHEEQELALYALANIGENEKSFGQLIFGDRFEAIVNKGYDLFKSSMPYLLKILQDITFTGQQWKEFYQMPLRDALAKEIDDEYIYSLFDSFIKFNGLNELNPIDRFLVAADIRDSLDSKKKEISYTGYLDKPLSVEDRAILFDGIEAFMEKLRKLGRTEEYIKSKERLGEREDIGIYYSKAIRRASRFRGNASLVAKHDADFYIKYAVMALNTPLSKREIDTIKAIHQDYIKGKAKEQDLYDYIESLQPKGVLPFLFSAGRLSVLFGKSLTVNIMSALSKPLEMVLMSPLTYAIEKGLRKTNLLPENVTQFYSNPFETLSTAYKIYSEIASSVPKEVIKIARQTSKSKNGLNALSGEHPIYARFIDTGFSWLNPLSRGLQKGWELYSIMDTVIYGSVKNALVNSFIKTGKYGRTYESLPESIQDFIEFMSASAMFRQDTLPAEAYYKVIESIRSHALRELTLSIEMFAKTGFGFLEQSFSYTPYGAIKAVLPLITKQRLLGKMLSEVEKNNFFQHPLIAAHLTNYLAKGMMGSFLFTLGFSGLLENLTQEEIDDELLDIESLFPTSSTATTRMRQEGGLFGSIRIGDKVFRLDNINPLLFPLLLGHAWFLLNKQKEAKLQDLNARIGKLEFNDELTDEEKAKRVEFLEAEKSKLIFDQAFINNLTNTTKYLARSAPVFGTLQELLSGNFDKIMLQSIRSLIPIPQFLYEIDAFLDPTLRETKTIQQKIINYLPFYRRTLPEVLDPFGREAKRRLIAPLLPIYETNEILLLNRLAKKYKITLPLPDYPDSKAKTAKNLAYLNAYLTEKYNIIKDILDEEDIKYMIDIASRYNINKFEKAIPVYIDFLNKKASSDAELIQQARGALKDIYLNRLGNLYQLLTPSGRPLEVTPEVIKKYKHTRRQLLSKYIFEDDDKNALKVKLSSTLLDKYKEGFLFLLYLAENKAEELKDVRYEKLSEMADKLEQASDLSNLPRNYRAKSRIALSSARYKLYTPRDIVEK